MDFTFYPGIERKSGLLSQHFLLSLLVVIFVKRSMYYHLFAGFLLCQHLLNMYYHPLTLLCQHLLNMYYRLLTQLYYGMSSLSSKEFLNSHKIISTFLFVNNPWKCVAWCTLWLSSFSFPWSIWYEMTPVHFLVFFLRTIKIFSYPVWGSNCTSIKWLSSYMCIPIAILSTWYWSYNYTGCIFWDFSLVKILLIACEPQCTLVSGCLHIYAFPL